MESVLQFGEGNFLRGFVDYMFDKLQKNKLFDGKIVVVQPIQNGFIDLLNEQNGEYNLLLRGVKAGKIVEEHSLIKIISRGINPYKNYENFLACARNPDFKYVVSNTTEAGIEFNEKDSLYDMPANTFPAKLTVFLYERYKFFSGDTSKGLLFLPCELIDNNGFELKACILKYSEQWGLETSFTNWIHSSNFFANTLVDRIVTGYSEELSLQYNDKLFNTAEIFHLWVIECEKDFSNELPFDKIGLNVIWTKNVTPFKKRKVRILNGAHTMTVLAAYLYGLRTVKDCMNDEIIVEYMKKGIFEEIIPTLDLPKEELIGYAKDVLERFSNPFIEHKLLGIALNSVSKFKVRVLPSILEYYKVFGEFPNNLSFSLAALIKFYKDGLANDDDDVVHFIKEHSILDILKNTKLWDEDLSNMVEIISYHYNNINEIGIKEAIKKL
jgi:tagaturonate reductase